MWIYNGLEHLSFDPLPLRHVHIGLRQKIEFKANTYDAI